MIALLGVFMKKTLLGLVTLLVLLLVVITIRTVRFTPEPVANVSAAAPIGLDSAGAVERFARALTFPTVSPQNPADRDTAAFLAFHAMLEESYPLVHERLERETVNQLSLLYRWQGRNPDLDPILLMGHMDVVPVIPGTEDDWTQPPFGGVVADGFVWGRGAVDDKLTVISILEAIEQLLSDGFTPNRTVYLAFGHDEEVGGREGAGVIADLLAERIDRPFAFVLDEGGAITEGVIRGIQSPIAIVGIAEKGFASLELRIEGAGGHSSTPPPHTTIGILAEAVTRLEQNPFPLRLDGAVEEMLLRLGPHQGLVNRIVMANLWLFRPLVARQMAGDPLMASMVRTTTAVTMFNAGVKDNVLPITASAVVNHRILPGETVESVIQRVTEIIDDERISVRPVSTVADPSPVSDPSSPAFQLIERTTRETFPREDLIMTPYLVMGGTDAKYYSGRSPNVFRFLPVMLGEEGMERVHGTDERVELASLMRSVRFFHRLLRNAEGLQGSSGLGD